jgi:hypothetical protein
VTRFGPLDVRNGLLVLGDDGGHHAVLTPRALRLRPFGRDESIIMWDDFDSVTVQFPQTRVRWPGLFTTLGIGALAALAGDWGIGSDPRDGELTLALREGHVEYAPLTCHHIGGYWIRSVKATSTLLTRLVTSPESRQLLAEPERLVMVLAGKH